MSFFFYYPDYKFFRNIYVDFTHDIEESICIIKYDLGKLLAYFISKDYFTLDTLNTRMNGLHYGKKEMRSKPVRISENDIKKTFLSFSASETLCFLRTVPLIMGDLE